MVETAALLVDEVFPARPIRQWVLTVPFPLRFLFAAYPELMGKVLAIVTRAITTHLARQAGFTKRAAPTGAVTLIQRFGSALNLNIHFHMLFLDGVYTQDATGRYCFRRTAPPTVEQLQVLLHLISEWVARFLERRGILERDEGNSYLTLEGLEEDPLQDIHSHSTTLETFEGKDIVVPNEVFITGTFVNWTRKNIKQRYRVDFSVAYDTDIRKLVEVIKEAVASHPQVLSGEEYPVEERPDCEIDSFGDSGVNMFVEFWIEAIDDGKNRVGGDLLLLIFETMREHGFTIPFPQREVRILQDEEIRLKTS